MSKLEKMVLTFFSFFAFVVLFVRTLFLFTIPISPLTLWVALGTYTIILLVIFKSQIVSTLLWFLGVIIILATVSFALSYTFDTSWDGQGYHQTAVIALKEGWNPIYSADISLPQELPSEIFAKSYPSAVWEIQATIYALTDRINSAKIINLAIAIVSGGVIYSLLRKLNLGKIVSFLVSTLIVLQPLYIVQFLSFMQDGLGYQLVLTAAASLAIFAIDKSSRWAASIFILSEVFLVSSKYSHLPLAAILGAIFSPIVINRFLNKDYSVTRRLKIFVLLALVPLLIFAYLPYGRNLVFHHHPFYPTNVADLSGSVTYNNLPHNLQNENKLVQFFYGIFSESQTVESGDTRSETNLAKLKIPFTFSPNEIANAARLYNNRVGAIGPLYSGAFLVALIFAISMAFKAETMKQKYTIYAIFFSATIVIFSSLLVPTPNLIRYVSQVQFLPFLLVVPILAIFKNSYAKVLASFVILLMLANSALYGVFVAEKTVKETEELYAQYHEMRQENKEYRVKAQHFYSSYIILAEQNVKFVAVERLACTDVGQLYASSTTTQYCRS